MTKAYQIKPQVCNKSMGATPAGARMWPVTDDHIYEEKLDGLRYLLQIRPNKSKQNYLTSRRVSVVTGEYVEKQDRTPYIRDFKFSKVWDDSIFDGEMYSSGLSSDTQHDLVHGRIVLHLFDVLRLNGVDVRGLPLIHRRELLNEFIFSHLHIEWLDKLAWHSDPKVLLDSVAEKGGEGIIRKSIQAPYTQKDWIKVKFDETEDCIITGVTWSDSDSYSKHGWIKSIVLSQWFSYVTGRRVVRSLPGNKFLCEVGTCSGFNEKVRALISADTKKHIGRVVEVRHNLRLRSNALRHPRFLRFRDDKNAEDCIGLSHAKLYSI